MEWIGTSVQVILALGAVAGAYTLLKVRISVLETRVDYLEEMLEQSVEEATAALAVITAELKIITASSIRQAALLEELLRKNVQGKDSNYLR